MGTPHNPKRSYFSFGRIVREGSFFHPLFIIIFVYTSWVSSSSCFSSWCWWWWWWWSMRLLLRVKRFGKSWSCWNLDLLVFLSKKVSIFYFIFYSSGITMILSPSCVSMNWRTLSFLVLAFFQLVSITWALYTVSSLSVIAHSWVRFIDMLIWWFLPPLCFYINIIVIFLLCLFCY